MRFADSSAWDYGNARVRALRSRLLDARRYADLMRASTVEALLGTLATTAYRPDVEASIARTPDLRRFDEVLRRHAARVLRALPGWYPGDANRIVQRMLAVWDWRNLRVILQAQVARMPAGEIEPLLVAAGSLDEAALATLARQDGLGAVVDLLRAWGLPARGLLDDDPLAALDRLWAPRLGGDAVDRINVMIALRLRAARVEEGVEAEAEFLPGGSLEAEALDDAARAPTREAAAAALPDPWPARLAGWVADDDLGALFDTLEIAALRDAARGFARGDPLGPAIPRAYIAAKQLELRNLRRTARGVEAGWPPTEIEEGLVFA